MSAVDCFDGESVRKVYHHDGDDGRSEDQEEEKKGSNQNDEDMLVAHPAVDGRLRNIGRE